MLCDVCHKKDALVHFTEIIDNQITKLHLCEECAKNKGLQFPFGKPLFSMGDLLAGLSNFDTYSTEQKSKIKCPNCGVTYDDFRRNGKLGCSQCYHCFKSELETLLKRIHGSNTHLGKVPAPLASKPVRKSKKAVLTENQLKKLQMDLLEAVKNEEYERAALIRDEIKDLKEINK
jgi:protein arginine kinase activator